MRRILFISALLLSICVSSFGMAFDNEVFNNHRQGFIIGGLGGIAVVTWKDDGVWINGYKFDAYGTNIALHIDFRVGGGFKGDKFMLYLWSVGNWFSIENYYDPDDPDDPEDNFIINGIGGLGVSYYFKPTSPSLYINAGIGIARWDGLQPGVGAMGGIGYEFTRHWSVECGVMWCNDMVVFLGPSNVDSLADSLSIIGIAY